MAAAFPHYLCIVIFGAEVTPSRDRKRLDSVALTNPNPYTAADVFDLARELNRPDYWRVYPWDLRTVPSQRTVDGASFYSDPEVYFVITRHTAQL
ncbi:uncharacterized protein APUU_80339S [Aspergillus puulaauensis]|uniref:Uncharacterized protein n=1 Tax=Aspergillus puulaauensis TaxID=1220207 RepID=A0A7R7XYJ3_9EURO|nr:uncharacterized protein APUU_80339S [Aspergillus puulaauensis]BCS30036.1 hypothetical protein APUU_80339S [Aspergillus puulaauensis]